MYWPTHNKQLGWQHMFSVLFWYATGVDVHERHSFAAGPEQVKHELWQQKLLVERVKPE